MKEARAIIFIAYTKEEANRFYPFICADDYALKDNILYFREGHSVSIINLKDIYKVHIRELYEGKKWPREFFDPVEIIMEE